MINLKNKAKINWSEIKISIIGAGISGIAAARLGKYLGAKIFITLSVLLLVTPIIFKQRPDR